MSSKRILMVSKKVVGNEFVISTEGRNLVFSRCSGSKISRSEIELGIGKRITFEEWEYL